MTKAIKVIYNSPARTQYPYDVKVNLTYNCEKENDKYFIRGNDFDREFALDFIKRMFKPCEGYEWDMLENKEEAETTLKQIRKTKVKKNKDE